MQGYGGNMTSNDMYQNMNASYGMGMGMMNQGFTQQQQQLPVSTPFDLFGGSSGASSSIGQQQQQQPSQ